MNWLKKTVSAILNVPRSVFRYVRNRYEAAIFTWGNRSYIFAANQDARLDADAMSRKEIMRKSRYFERNNAFVNRLADIFEQYTVGAAGLQVVSASKDATDYFNRYCADCDCTGLMPFGMMQSVIARAWFIDGETFIVRVVIKGRLKLQLIEAHRVYTPPHLATGEGKTIIDGIAIDANGCVTGIWVNTAQSGNAILGSIPGLMTESVDDWKFVAAEDVIHVFEPNRAGMYRGLPFLYPVMNDLHDLDDLQVLTAQVAKQAATLGNVTTNKTGEFSSTDSRRALLNIQSQNAAGLAVTKSMGEYYQVKIGASEIALQKGDSIKQFQAERPSLAEREHWDYLLSKVCCGVGISKLLVMPFSMQGTVTRADLDIAAAFFRARSSVIQSAIARVFLWTIEWAEKYDREVIRGGFNFDGYENVTVRPPRSPNVDVGRNSKALVSELESKIRTYQDVLGESGIDWRTHFDQVKAEQDYAAEIGIELGPPAPAKPEDAAEETAEEQDELPETK